MEQEFKKLEKEFREYLNNHTKLAKNSINSYATALRLNSNVYQKVRDNLKYNSFYDIDNINTYNEQYLLIQNIIPNQNNTNGNLSASLAKYKLFLQYKEVIKQMDLYDKNPQDFHTNKNVFWYFKIINIDKYSGKYYPVKAMLKNIQDILNINAIYTTDIAKSKLKEIFKDAVSFEELDNNNQQPTNERDTDMNKKISSEPKIWKMSHSDLTKEGKYDETIEQKVVCMGEKTSRGQAKNFKNAESGDLFYLLKNPKNIELIGKFVDNKTHDTYGREDDISRKYETIFEANSTSNSLLIKGKESWKPSGNSTFYEVPKSSYKEFEDKILKHHFGKTLNDLNISVNSTNEIMKNNNNIEIPLNQILYGPPGTGKTYSTVEKALEILQDDSKDITSIQQLKDKYPSQVEFVTFHQSFSYEDFVEGLKAKSDDNNKLSYSVENGIFKEICKRASSKAEIIVKNIDISPNATIWKMSLGNSQTDEAQEYFEEAKNKSSLVLGWGDDNDFSNCKNIDDIKKIFDYKSSARFVDIFKHQMRIGDIVIISDGRTKFKAIAEITGYYYYDKGTELPQKRKIKWLQTFSESRPRLEISDIIFAQDTVHEAHGIDKNKLQEYLTDKQNIEGKKPYILIIDEINRGNISRIFGELITLIEPSKRAGQKEAISVTLPYSKKPFSVPDNLYIIATMNTADRSLALIDTALRRRFSFTEMMPKINLVDNFDNIDVQKILKSMNERIEFLHSREHTIGHSFLMKVEDLAGLKNAFKNNIMPLLEEYFFDNWHKIKQVLNDKGDKFYEEIKTPSNLASDSDSESRKHYKRCNLNDLIADDFKNIYKENIQENTQENTQDI